MLKKHLKYVYSQIVKSKSNKVKHK